MANSWCGVSAATDLFQRAKLFPCYRSCEYTHHVRDCHRDATMLPLAKNDRIFHQVLLHSLIHGAGGGDHAQPASVASQRPVRGAQEPCNGRLVQGAGATTWHQLGIWLAFGITCWGEKSLEDLDDTFFCNCDAHFSRLSSPVRHPNSNYFGGHIS